MSKYKKLTVPLILVLSLVLLAVFGKALAPKSAAAAGNGNRIPVVFWHEMGGPAEKALEKIVDGYNKSQTKYEVIPKYQGTYDEAVQKVLQTHGTSTSPAVFQSFDASTAQMMNSGYTTPVQKFIDSEHYDVDKISPVARAFYAKGGVQRSMPFNTSQPVLYYNASLLKKYNITPPPVSPTYSDITRVAKELYEKSGHKVKGLNVQTYGWFMEQAQANSGAQLVNRNDGHTGNPTKATYDNPATKKFFAWILENIKSGDFIDYGTGSSAGANQIAGFLSNKVGMFVQSSATISQLLKNNKNELGITYFPHPDGQKANGVAIGGASLWISNDKSEETQKGAFDFIKYTLRPEVQAGWQKATGYLALNKDSQDTDTLKELYAKNPEKKVAGDQLAAATPNYSNSGVLVEGMQLTRQLEEVAMGSIYNGGDVDQAVKKANKDMDENIAQVNKANGYK